MQQEEEEEDADKEKVVLKSRVNREDVLFNCGFDINTAKTLEKLFTELTWTPLGLN